MIFLIERARACGIKWVGLSMKRSIKPIGFDNCNSGRSGHIVRPYNKNIQKYIFSSGLRKQKPVSQIYNRNSMLNKVIKVLKDAINLYNITLFDHHF